MIQKIRILSLIEKIVIDVRGEFNREGIMVENIAVEPMGEEFVLWRCLHHGPLSEDTIDSWPSEDGVPWERFRERNAPLLTKLTKTYGACAVVAREGERVVGQLRFYPKAVCEMQGAGYLCLQQDSPAGPDDNFAESDFPALEQIEEKTLTVHCLMAGCSPKKDNPYQRMGLGSRMVEVLIQWAGENGWEGIEADSFEDLPLIYDVTGSAGHTFWEKLGFHIADRHPHPDLQDQSDFAQTLDEQAKSLGIPAERARDQIIMRLDLT